MTGQLGRKVSGVAACWRRLGYDVEHWCGGDFGDGWRADNDYGAPSVHGRFYRRWRLLRPLTHSVSEWRDIRHDALLYSELRRRAEVFQPGLIWERSCRLHCAGLRLAREKCIPYVLEWKDHLVPYRWSLFRIKALRMEALKNQEADFIVVESGVLRDRLTAEGLDAGKILVAYNAVNPDDFRPHPETGRNVRATWCIEPGEVLVGYLGSYAFYHDAARLVLAAKVLREQGYRNIRVVMVGQGQEFAETRDLARKLGLLGTTVIMKSGVPANEVPGILAALDIAVLPGSTDIICPIKVQEYMAAGVATVAPDYACNREVITDGVDGLLFPPKQEVGLAEKIAELACSPVLRARLGGNARQTVVARFTWERTWGAALDEIMGRIALAGTSSGRS